MIGFRGWFGRCWATSFGVGSRRFFIYAWFESITMAG